MIRYLCQIDCCVYLQNDTRMSCCRPVHIPCDDESSHACRNVVPTTGPIIKLVQEWRQREAKTALLKFVDVP